MSKAQEFLELVESLAYTSRQHRKMLHKTSKFDYKTTKKTAREEGKSSKEARQDARHAYLATHKKYA